jgi:hypothetical protein
LRCIFRLNAVVPNVESASTTTTAESVADTATDAETEDDFVDA